MMTLQELINRLTVSSLKELLDYLPGAEKVGRKEVLVSSMLQHMAGAGWRKVWDQLDSCQRLAVGEAAHDAQGIFRSSRFVAKYGQWPLFEQPRPGDRFRSGTVMTPLCLFLYEVDGYMALPHDLHAELKAFAPKPAPNVLSSHAAVPDANDDAAPLTVRTTEAEALHDAVAMLRAVDQGLIAVSEKTRLPGLAAQRVVAGKLAGGDFYELTAAQDQWEQVVGPIKALAWPMLVQADGMAQLKGTKLTLTAAGRQALNMPPAEVVRGIWRNWLASSLHDEFSRIDNIKGQKGKGVRLTPIPPRRAAICQALRHCPTAAWTEVDELMRFMQAEAYRLDICDAVENLYISDPQYGSLMCGGWKSYDMVRLRYLLCVLFEYCATLGVIDVAFQSPHGARSDYADLWGADELTFLSRYDGLQAIRLTALGAYCLGLSDSYTPPVSAATCALSVQADLTVNVSSGALSAEEHLMLDNWASTEDSVAWRLDQQKTIAAIERGHDTGQLAAFLQARDSQPLPSKVESFLRDCSKKGKAMKVLAQSVLIECADPDTADLIAAHKDTARLCMRAGKQHLVVLQDRESAFRGAVRQLGYGIAL